MEMEMVPGALSVLFTVLYICMNTQTRKALVYIAKITFLTSSITIHFFTQLLSDGVN